MKTIRIGDVQNSLVRLILWQVGRESITDRHLRSAKDFFGNRCAYCGEEKELHFDHAVPINKTALGQHRVGNLVPSCGNCNQKKGQRDFREYLKDDPNGDIKIAKILEYMERHNYLPLNDDKKVKALLEEARKEVADVAAKYIAAIDKSLADSPTVLPPPTPELPAVPTLPALPAVVSEGSNGMNGSTHTGPNLGKISEIKKTMNRSWINLRRGCLDQMGVSVPHGTPKVGASSRTFAKKAHEATGLKYADIVALLDQHRLGLEG
jgi:HNH endonuclease